MENIRFRKPVRPGDRLRARYTVLVTEPSAKRPTLGKILGRTEVLDEAGDVVYPMDGWGLVGRRPQVVRRVHHFVSGGSYPPPP